MTNWIKYLYIASIFIFAFVLVAVIGLRQSTTVATVQEVQVAMQSSLMGEIRNSSDMKVDKEAMVTNLILEMVEAHKEQGTDLKIDYVFLDEHGNPTDIEENISSVQYQVQQIDNFGRVVSSSEYRMSLKKFE